MLTSELTLAIGGCAANVAVGLSRLGIRAQIAGRVGDDAFGKIVATQLVEQGVDCASLRVTSGEATSQTLIVNVANEDRRFIHTFGANARMTVGDVPLDDVLKSRILYVGGYLLMPSFERAELAALLAKARAAGVRTVLDVCVPGAGDHVKELVPVLPLVDVFMPNAHEAEAITGIEEPALQAAYFQNLGARTVIVTCGGEGTFVAPAPGEAPWRAGVYPVDCVDGSGGGDAFAAGYMYGMAQGLGVEDCVRYGSALGASCVRRLGTTAGLFDRDECERFVATQTLEVARCAAH